MTVGSNGSGCTGLRIAAHGALATAMRPRDRDGSVATEKFEGQRQPQTSLTLPRREILRPCRPWLPQARGTFPWIC
jgi:hypothetical protein